MSASFNGAREIVVGLHKRKLHFMKKANHWAQRLLRPLESIWPAVPKILALRIQDGGHVSKMAATITDIAFIDRF